MIPGSLFSGEFTLGLIAQIRICSAGKGFSNAFKCPFNHFSEVFWEIWSD
jgi:hypothetical protein